MAAILGAASSFDQSFFRQIINQDDHAAGEHAESFRQRPLIARGSRRDHAQNPGMSWSDAQSFNPLAKTISRVCAELCEEKGGAAWPLFAGFHNRAGSLKKLLAKINRSYNE